jgi:tetratricopeptide (TPR) repeat protein
MSITQAAENCRKAWAKSPKAKWAWCCHHALELELLTTSPENRIKYILACKPNKEKIARLNNFRPVSKLPLTIAKAEADYDKAGVDYDKALADYVKASADYDKAGVDGKAGADYDKALADYDKALADYVKASADYDKAGVDYVILEILYDKALADYDKEELARLHSQDVPNHTWNGVDIFERKNRKATR